MEIGGCHRDYPARRAYQRRPTTTPAPRTSTRTATCTTTRPGWPFPRRAIDMKAPDAAVKWAWNFEQRDRGAGPSAASASSTCPAGSARRRPTRARSSSCGPPIAPICPETTTRRRSAATRSGSRAATSTSPSTRAISRGASSARRRRTSDYQEADDTFVYVPTMRKVRRSATSWVDGLYAPRYLVAGVESAGGGVPFGSNEYGRPARSSRPPASRSPRPRTCGAASSASRSARTPTTGGSSASAKCSRRSTPTCPATR